jgi:hypothetical protein
MKVLGAIVAVAAVGSLLTGCASVGQFFDFGGNAKPSASTSASTSTPKPTPTRVKPNFIPAVNPGSAAANQRLFVILLEQGLVAEGISANPASQAERLTAAGFDPAGVSWTDSSTAIGLLADTVFISAQVGAECLIGQYGTAIQTVAISVAPALPSGGCLVGAGINHF